MYLYIKDYNIAFVKETQVKNMRERNFYVLLDGNGNEAQITKLMIREKL